MRLRDPAAVFRTLAALHRAGVPWVQAVDSADRGRGALAGVRRRLEAGEAPSEAFGDLLDPLDRALLRAGEADGSIEQVLEDMAQAHEEAARQRREGLTMAFYPLVLAHVAAVLLPLPDLLRGRPVAGLLWAAAVLVPLWTWLLARRVQARAERPRPGGAAPSPPRRGLFGARPATLDADARALGALGRLVDAGVDLREAIPLAQQAGWGGRVAVDLERAAGRVAAGEDVAGAWRCLPPDLAGRLASAEGAGELGEAARRLAEALRFEARTIRERIARVLPIVLVLLLGGLVAIRVLGFYAEVYGRAIRGASDRPGAMGSPPVGRYDEQTILLADEVS